MLSAPAIDADLATRLDRLGPGSLRARATDRLAFAHDASHYLLIPAGVVTVTDADAAGRAAAAVARAGRAGHLPLRRHQPVRPGVDRRRCWSTPAATSAPSRCSTAALRVRVQPGATVRQVNARLARHGRKLGPDPASEAACTHRRGRRQQLQRHGLRHRIQHLQHHRVGRPRAAQRHRRSTPARPTPTGSCASASRELCGGPGRAARPGPRQPRVGRGRSAASSPSRTPWATALNAFLDHDRPVDILPAPDHRQRRHARVRRRGHASAPCRCKPHAATGCCSSRRCGTPPGRCPALVGAGLGDRRAARRRLPAGRPARPEARTRRCSPWPSRGHAALLVEYQEADAEALAAEARRLAELVAGLPLAAPAVLSDDPAAPGRPVAHPQGPVRRRRRRPAVRDHRAARGHRRPGDRLLADLRGADRAVRPRTATQDSVIFGHAKDGNIHFMLTERFDDARLARALRRVHRGHGRPGARPRRHAEGRARHRADHGPVRPPPVRRRAVRGHARGQAAARPGRRCSTPACC